MNPKDLFSDAPFFLWGILNCTPDSFYDGNGEGSLKRAEKAISMVEEGANIIDVGGESTRPGAEAVSDQQEMDRVLPVIEEIRHHSDVMISIDTMKASVAEAALRSGANIVNDVSGGRDPKMAPLIAKSKSHIVLMHMKGSPRTMQKDPTYVAVIEDVRSFLEERISFFEKAGVAKGSILIDPGIGFGKTVDHNLELMAKLDQLEELAPVLLGVSRKSFIGGVDSKATSPKDRLPGSLAPISFALKCGVRHFRIHDVRETRQFILVTQRLQEKVQ